MGGAIPIPAVHEAFCGSNNTLWAELEMVMDQLHFLPVIDSVVARGLLQPALYFMSRTDGK